MELLGKLESNNTLKLGRIHSALKDVSIKFTEQFLQIINSKDRLNVLKGSTKIKDR